MLNEGVSFDQNIKIILDVALARLKAMNVPWSDSDVRMGLVLLNLTALIQNLLMVDNNDKEAKSNMNLSNICLGLMGVCDFLEESLPPSMMVQ